MITINVQLNLPSTAFEKESVVTVYFKNRNNIIGTCTIQKKGDKTVGAFAISEELHDSLYIFYIFSSTEGNSILEGILLDDISSDKNIDTVGSMKIS